MNVYKETPLMQLIENQKFPLDTDAGKECQTIIDAYKPELFTPGHRGNAICAVVMDAFLLGMIYGKREERRKRKGRTAKAIA